jgi:hypothetical protein
MLLHFSNGGISRFSIFQAGEFHASDSSGEGGGLHASPFEKGGLRGI